MDCTRFEGRSTMKCYWIPVVLTGCLPFCGGCGSSPPPVAKRAEAAKSTAPAVAEKLAETKNAAAALADKPREEKPVDFVAPFDKNRNLFKAPPAPPPPPPEEKKPVEPAPTQFAEAQPAPVPVEEEIRRPEVRLIGFMEVDDPAALLLVDGKMIVLEEGDEQDQLELLCIDENEIELKFREETWTIDLLAQPLTVASTRTTPVYGATEPSRRVTNPPRAGRGPAPSNPAPSGGSPNGSRTPTGFQGGPANPAGMGAPSSLPPLPPLPGSSTLPLPGAPGGAGAIPGLPLIGTGLPAGS